MVPNPNDTDGNLDFFVNIAVVQMLAILQTIAGMAGLTGDKFIIFFTRVITRMHSSVANPIATSSTPVNEPPSHSPVSSSDATSSHHISLQSGDRIGSSSELSPAQSPVNASASLTSSTAAASPAPEPRTTLPADIASGSTSTIIASSNNISSSEPDIPPAASPHIATEFTPVATFPTLFSSSVTPTDDRSLCLTSAVPSTTRRRPRPLRREGACIFQNVAGQVTPVPLPIPITPTIYAPAPVFFPPAFITAAPASALAHVTSSTIPISSVSDTPSHLLIHDIPVPGSPVPSSASSKRSWDEVDLEDDENEAVEFCFSYSSVSSPKRRRS